jgi:hypothetical protein
MNASSLLVWAAGDILQFTRRVLGWAAGDILQFTHLVLGCAQQGVKCSA